MYLPDRLRGLICFAKTPVLLPANAEIIATKKSWIHN
jgi:hypothetical protein